MRRLDRQKDKEFALKVLKECEYATLATSNPDGTPYCIPISVVVIEGAIFFHCALKGKKLDNIMSNAAVCVSAVGYTKLVPEKFTTEFESAVALGTCEIIADEEEKTMALRAICEKYALSNIDKFEKAIAKSLPKTCICKINISEITGKANIY